MKMIEERAETICTFKKFEEGMSDKDVLLHNILMQEEEKATSKVQPSREQ